MAIEKKGKERNNGELSAILPRRLYKKDDFVWREGDPGDFACIVRTGSVFIVKEGGRDIQILTKIMPNQLFGEFALINGGIRTATAVAAEATEVLMISQDQFKAKMDGLDVFMKYWLDYLMDRVLDLSARVER